jgi:allantoicase
VRAVGPATRVRFNIFPDGGVSRLRLFGAPASEGWERIGLERLNALPPDEAEAELLRCCGSPAWARRMAEVRPFASRAALENAADLTWGALPPAGWRAAFAAHPRIGEKTAPGWSREEQSGAAAAGDATRARLAEAQRAYEARFGHLFLVCATGRGAEELLALLERRLSNTADLELRVAADEQRKITRLRLGKLLHPEARP